MTTWRTHLGPTVCVFLLLWLRIPGVKTFLITDGLVQGQDNNVCRTPVTRAQGYDVVRTRIGYTVYYTSCGFIYWSRCTRYRQVTRYYTQRLYRTQYGQKLVCCVGWQRSGNTCRTPICVAGCGHGICTAPDTCNCTDGWTGAQCTKDIDECASKNISISNGNITLSNATANFTSNKANNCSQMCNNTAGSFTCGCYPGYRINANDTTLCDDVNECQENNRTCTCSPSGLSESRPCNVTCENTIGSFMCKCSLGYNATGGQVCTDINECALNVSGCSQKCFNTGGSYYCGCNFGYILAVDGHTCNDIDECRLTNNGCEHICVNENGTYHCECRKGYVLDSNGRTCSDHDECQKSDHGCSQICNNYHGSYNCSCRTGYRILADHRSCQDIDECIPSWDMKSNTSKTLSGCQHICSNTNGSFVCSCRPGFALLSNGKNCTDVDECASGTHQCDHNCHNTIGSYVCTCDPGYVLESDNNTCRALPCKEKLATPFNGRRKCSGYTTNETCTFSCHPGYDSRGSSLRHCLPTAKWSGKEFTCQAKNCPILTPPKNAFVPVACRNMRPYGLLGCNFRCLSGYYGDGEEQVTCNVTKNMNDVKWIIGNFSCKAIKPCKPSPCLHEGTCSINGNTNFNCDCTNTGYVGNRCQIGIVGIPEIPKLKIGVTSNVLSLEARPSKALKVSFSAGERITINPPNKLSISFPLTQANFTITALLAGVHILSYHLSGPSENDFRVPGKSVFLVEPAFSSRLNVFEKLSLVNKELPSGKYSHQDTGSFSCNVTFSSTNPWQRIGDSITTTGIVYANSIPLSLIGANLTELAHVPNNIIETLSQKSDVTTESGFDFVEYLQYDSFPRSFIKRFSKLAPHWFSAAVKANNSGFSIFHTFGIVGAPPFSSSTSRNAATTAVFSFRVQAEINLAQTRANLSGDSFTNFVVDLCSSEIFIELSKSNILGTRNLPLLRDMSRKGWNLEVQAIGFDRYGDLSKQFHGVSWNGLNTFSFAPFKPRIWIRGGFKINASSTTTGILEASVVVQGQVAINLTSLDGAFKDGLRQKLALSIGASKAEFSIKAQALESFINLHWSSVDIFGQAAFGGQDEHTSCSDPLQGFFFTLENTSNPWKNSALEKNFVPSSDNPKFLAIHYDMLGGEQVGIRNTQELLGELKLLETLLTNFKKVLSDISKGVPPMRSDMNRWLQFTETFKTSLTSAVEMLNKTVTHTNIGQFENNVKELEENRQFASGLASLLMTQLNYHGKYYLTKDLIRRVETFRLNLPRVFSLNPVIANVTQTLNGISFLMTIDYCMEQLCLAGINATISYPLKQTCIYSYDTSVVSESKLAFVLKGRMKQGANIGHMISISARDEIIVITKRDDSQKLTIIEANFNFLKSQQKVTMRIVNNVLSFQTEWKIFDSYDVLLNANASTNITEWSSLTIRVTGKMNKTSKLVKQLNDKVQTYSKKLVLESLHRINVSKDACDRAVARRKQMEFRYSETMKLLNDASLKRNKAAQSLTDAKSKYLSAKNSVSVVLGNSSNLLDAFENACILSKCNHSCLSVCEVHNIQEKLNTTTLTRFCETKFKTQYIADTVNTVDTIKTCKPVPESFCEGFCGQSTSGMPFNSPTNSVVLGKISLAVERGFDLFGGCLFKCREKPGPCKMMLYKTVSKSFKIVPGYLQEYQCSDFKEVLTNANTSGNVIVPRCKSNSCIKNLDFNCSQDMNTCHNIQQQIQLIVKGQNTTAVTSFQSMQDFGTKLNLAKLDLEAASKEEDFAKRKNKLTNMRLAQLQEAENLLNVSLQKVKDLDEIGVKLSRHLALNNDTSLLTVENILFAIESQTSPKPVFPVNVRVTAYTGAQKTINVSMDFERIDASLTVAAEKIVSEFFSHHSGFRRRRRSVSTSQPPVNITESIKEFSDCTFATRANFFFNAIVKSLIYAINARNTTLERLDFDSKVFLFQNENKTTSLYSDTQTNKTLPDVADSLSRTRLMEILRILYFRQSELLLWNETTSTWRSFIQILTNAQRFDGCFSFEDCVEILFVRLEDLYRFQDDVSEGEVIKRVLPKIKTILIELIKDNFTVDETNEKTERLLELLNVAQDYFVLCGEKPKIIRVSPKIVTAIKGNNVVLECDWRSHTSATVRWSKNGEEIPSKTKKTLELLNITKQNEGVYSCQVSNRKGSVISNVTFVKVETKPQITKQPVSVNLIPGGDEAVEFICNATGDPSPTLQWVFLRENSRIPEVLTGYNQSRFYRQPGASEPGLYYCEATNRNGVVPSDKARLDILNATIAYPRVAAFMNVTVMCRENSTSVTRYTCANTSLTRGTSEAIKKALIRVFSTESTLLQDFRYHQHGISDARVTFTLAVDRSSFSNLVIPSFNDKARTIDIERRKMLQQLVQLYKNITSNDFVVMVNGSKVVGVPESLEASLPPPSCDAGQRLHENWLVCVNCVPGWYENGNRTCLKCPKGSYQPLQGQTKCNSCPTDHTTSTDGAVEMSQCFINVIPTTKPSTTPSSLSTISQQTSSLSTLSTLSTSSSPSSSSGTPSSSPIIYTSSSSPSARPPKRLQFSCSAEGFVWGKDDEKVLKVVLKTLSATTKIAVSHLEGSDIKILKGGFKVTVVFPPEVNEEVLVELKAEGFKFMYKKTQVLCRLVENKPHARASQRKSETKWLIPVIVVGVVILIIVVLALVYVKRRRKLKDNSSRDVRNEFWNDAYEECPVKGQILQPPIKDAPGSKRQDEVPLDELSGTANKDKMKETEDDSLSFDEDMNTLKLEFENPMFETSA